MTAVADVQAGLVRATVEIAAAPEAVFRALTDPTELPRWWGSPELYRTDDWKVDLRPGGKWSCQARSPQGDSEVRGEYLAIEPPRLLEYTWEPAWEQYRQTIIRCTLRGDPGRHPGERGPPRVHCCGVCHRPCRGLDPGARVARRPVRRHPRALGRPPPPDEDQQPEQREPRRRRTGGDAATALACLHLHLHLHRHRSRRLAFPRRCCPRFPRQPPASRCPGGPVWSGPASGSGRG